MIFRNSGKNMANQESHKKSRIPENYLEFDVWEATGVALGARAQRNLPGIVALGARILHYPAACGKSRHRARPVFSVVSVSLKM